MKTNTVLEGNDHDLVIFMKTNTVLEGNDHDIQVIDENQFSNFRAYAKTN
jgi:hypothetical protein